MGQDFSLDDLDKDRYLDIIMGKDKNLGPEDYEWILYHKDMIDEVYADVPYGDIEVGREFVLKFNGLLVWSIREC